MISIMCIPDCALWVCPLLFLSCLFCSLFFLFRLCRILPSYVVADVLTHSSSVLPLSSAGLSSIKVLIPFSFLSLFVALHSKCASRRGGLSIPCYFSAKFDLYSELLLKYVIFGLFLWFINKNVLISWFEASRRVHKRIFLRLLRLARKRFCDHRN